MTDRIAELITQHAGIVLRSDLHHAGLTNYDIDQQVRQGVWRRAGRRLLVHASAPDDLRTNTLIAAKRRPKLPLTGASAALLMPHPAWSGVDFKTKQALLISDRSTGGPWRDVAHPGAAWDVDKTTGLVIADHLTTLIDLLRFLPPGPAQAVAGAATQAGMATPDELLERAALLEGRAGAQQLARLVRAMLRGAESAPEVDLHRALHKAGFRGWKANPEVLIGGKQYRTDIAFMKERIAIEYQGYLAHAGPAALARDWERHNDFCFDGWAVLYLTKETFYSQHHWDTFCERLAQLRTCRAALQIALPAQITLSEDPVPDL